MVSDGVGVVSGWFRVVSGLEGSGQCQVLSGLQDVYALLGAIGAVGLSDCRVSGAVGWCQTVGAVSGRAA